MRKVSRSYPSWSVFAIVALIFFSALLVGLQPTLGSTKPDGTPTNGYSCKPLSFSRSSPWFYYPTSCIRILILYDLSTGAQVYADKWGPLLGDYGYNATLLSIQQATSNISLTSHYDLVLVDHSCGGDGGEEINQGEANALSGISKPLVLLGGAHGVIDRLANYVEGTGRINVAGTVQKAQDMVHHEIYTSPYLITETVVGPSDSIEIFSQTVSLESYPENVINGLHDFGIVDGATNPVIGALFSARGSSGRVYWWAFQDPSKLNANGMQLFINTVEWMGGFTNFGPLFDFLQGTESTDPLKSTYWTGGFGDYFEPQIPATYYAYESLRLIGRLSAINTSALADWLASHCYSTDGSFFKSPSRYLSSSCSGVVETGMALQILSGLGALSKLNLTKISTYIKSCQLVDGFVRYPGDTSKRITNTYWALIALNITGSVNNINRTGAIDYIASCQNVNPADTANYGGFANYPRGVSYASYTYLALKAVKLLDAMGSVNMMIVENWLMNGYVAPKGMFYEELVVHQRSQVTFGTSYSTASLSLLGKLNRINQSLVAGYLSSVQFGDGGWSGANCTDESVDEVADCYPAILGLSELGRIDAIRDVEGLVGFITRCLSPTPTYGFSNLPQTLSNIWHTYNGISVLHDLGMIDATKARTLNSSILSSYDGYRATFEWYRLAYPASSDGYNCSDVNIPFEFSFLQRGAKGVILTDLAIISLLDLGSKDWIDSNAQNIWSKVSQCEVTTGSYGGYYTIFSGALVNNLTAGIRYTYHALNCLWILAGFLNYTGGFPSHLTNASMTIERIISLYDPLIGRFRDDGYILEPYSPVETTFMALASLQLLNAVHNVDYIKTTEYLKSHLYSNLVDTYYSFKGLQVLNKLSAINATRLLDFVKDCQKPSGVFKSDYSASYRLETTRMATEILSYYNQTWITAQQTKVVINSISAPSTMNLGSNYLLNLTLTDGQFNLPMSGATVKVRLGTHEYTGIETPANSGEYVVSIAVPVQGALLRTQGLAIRASKDRFQTGTTQMTVQISGYGVIIKAQTEVVLIRPGDSDYLTTSNTTITALILALDQSWIPVGRAELRLYVNDSLADTMSSNSSGQLSFSWRPNSSGIYDLRVIFEGSDTLNASWATKVINIEKTPTKLTLSSDYAGVESVEVGSTIRLMSKLLDRNGFLEKLIVGANITLMVLAPSGKELSLNAVTRNDGVASVEVTISETGIYSLYSVFESTGYYSGSTSDVLLVKAISNLPQNGGGGNGGEGVSWVDALLSAIASPGGIVLLVASAGLLSVVYLLGAKQRELESLNGRRSQRNGRRTSAAEDSTPVSRKT